MRLEVIPLSSVEPDKKNPRKDFGDINALADTFKLNADNPGEPVNAIVVVRDGSIYRIVDGERRYRAMRSIGKETCHAVVCEGMDEANAMIAMLATDDKLTLTDVERSRGVQQMLLLGVDPAKVEKVGKMRKGSHKSVIRAIYSAGDNAQSMTLDQLIVIDEFESDGDDDAVARLVEKTDPAEFAAEVEAIRRERDNAARVEAFERACAAAGVPVEDAVPSGYFYSGWVPSAEQVAEKAERLREGAVAVINDPRDCSFFEPRATQADEPGAEDAEAAALRERIEKMGNAATVAEASQALWYAELADDPKSTPATDALLIARWFDGGNYSGRMRREKAAELLGDDGSDAYGAMSGWVAAWMFDECFRSVSALIGSILRGSSSTYHTSRAGLWLEQMDAMVSDGYVAGEADMAVADALAAFLSESESEDEGEVPEP